MHKAMDDKYKKLQGKSADAFKGIPENYFAGLPDKILKKAVEKQKDNRKYYLRPAFTGIAAGLLLMVSLGIVLFFITPHQEREVITEIHTPEYLSELSAYHSEVPQIVFYDTLKPDGQKPGRNEQLSGGSSEDIDDLFADIDDLPADVIVEYLLATKEFEF
jgi:hypothetical protein